jgi:hypothetical protein
MVPVLAKCISFIGLNQSDLNSVERIRAWVMANKSTSYSGPGSTNRSSGHIVPFYTPNALPCREKFGEGYVLIDSGNILDEHLGMKLLHGFIGAGAWGNNSYSTVPISEIMKWPDNKADNTKRLKAIDEHTVGAKLYFQINRKNLESTLNYNIVIVVVHLRVEGGEVHCLPFQVRTNGHWVGGHGAYRKEDTSYRRYTRESGWGNAWSSDTFEASKDKEREKKIHAKIIRKIEAVLCQ